MPFTSRTKGQCRCCCRVALLIGVLVVLLSAPCGLAALRPFVEKREGNELAEQMAKSRTSPDPDDPFFFGRLHDSKWPQRVAYSRRVDAELNSSGLLSEFEAVRGGLLAERAVGRKLFLTSVERLNETKASQARVAPYAHLLPFVTQQQYLPADVSTPNATRDRREAGLSATRHWPYYFRYERFESLAAADMHRQTLCGVAQLDRGSYGLESFGVDEVLMLVYNDWNSHVEHALALAEAFACAHLSLHRLSARDLDPRAAKALGDILHATDTSDALTLLTPDGGAFAGALHALLKLPAADETADDMSTDGDMPAGCEAPNTMLWVPVWDKSAEAASSSPMQLIVAARQRQFAPPWYGAPFAGLYRSLFLLDLHPAPPYFAVVRDGILSPVPLPVTHDTSLDAVRRFVVQQSPSTFFLRSAEQFVGLADQYGQLALALPVCKETNEETVATGPRAPWTDAFRQAFVSLRQDIPMFGLDAQQVARLAWDRMSSLPAKILPVPPSALLLPELNDCTMGELRKRLGLGPVTTTAADHDDGDGDASGVRDTTGLVCVRLVVTAVRHSTQTDISDTDKQRWRWQDVCVPGLAPNADAALWDRVLGAELRDAVRTVLDTTPAMTLAHDVSNGVAFRRTMQGLLKRPAPRGVHVLLVPDIADGSCGDAARSSVYDHTQSAAISAFPSVVVVDAEAHALQEELSSAAEAAMTRRQQTEPTLASQLEQYYTTLFSQAGPDHTCRLILATSGGELHVWPPPPSAVVRTAARYPLESLFRPALHHALETLETRVMSLSNALASEAELRSSRFLTTRHETPWELVVPAGQNHPVTIFDFTATSSAATRVEVVALTDRSCGLCANTLKSARLLRACEAPVAEVDLRDLWLQRRGAAPQASLYEAKDDSPLLASVRAHVAADLATLRPPQWFVSNGTHVLTTFPSTGYTEKNSWDVVVTEWMRLMGLDGAAADALHRCVHARLEQNVRSRRQYRASFSGAESESSTHSESTQEAARVVDGDDVDGDL